jgi:hypothetical protein
VAGFIARWRGSGGKVNVASNGNGSASRPDARFSAMHTTVEAGTREDARRYVAADRARWRKVIQDAQIQPE